MPRELSCLNQLKQEGQALPRRGSALGIFGEPPVLMKPASDHFCPIDEAGK
jgi:hypothetical protein